MATAIAEQDLDLDAIERDASEKLEELEEHLERLMPELLAGDEDARQEVADLESERAAAEAAIRHATAARAELVRRDAEARAKAEAEARAVALAAAKKLEPERLKAAKDADAAIRTLGRALADLRRLTKAESEELVRAGRSELISPTRVGYKGALMLGFKESGLSLHDVLEVELLEDHRRRSLVDLTRPVSFEERSERAPRPPRPEAEPEKPRTIRIGALGWRDTYRGLIANHVSPERALVETAKMVGREVTDPQLVGQIEMARRELEREGHNTKEGR